LLQQASTTREAERYKILPARPGPPKIKKRKGLKASRHTRRDASGGRFLAARDERQLNLELLGQSRRRKFFPRMAMAHGERRRAYGLVGSSAARAFRTAMARAPFDGPWQGRASSSMWAAACSQVVWTLSESILLA
jgi:hypothetical protein